MKKHIIEHVLEQRTEEWFELRKGIITSSDISAIMAVKGLGDGAITLAEEKAWQIVHGFEDNNFTTFDMQRGVELEPIAFEEAQDHLSPNFLNLRKSGFFVNELLKTGSSPDGIISDNGGYEVKAPSISKFRKIILDDNFTPEIQYFRQMQHQMLTANLDYILHHNFAVYNGKPHSHYYIVEKCEDTQEIMRERIPQFNALVKIYVERFMNL